MAVLPKFRAATAVIHRTSGADIAADIAAASAAVSGLRALVIFATLAAAAPVVGETAPISVAIAG